MPLPFKNPSKPKIHTITDPIKGDLEFEILGTVTFEEELEIIGVLRLLEGGGGAAPEKMHQVQLGLATVALRRLVPDWKQGDTKQLPITLIRSCSEFLLNERNQWKQPDPAAKKKLISTGENTNAASEKTTPPSTTDLQQPGPETPDGTPTDSPKTPSPKSKKQA